MKVFEDFGGKRFFLEVPSKVWVAGKWIFILLFMKMAFHYLGALEAIARGIISGDLEVLFFRIAIPPLIALLYFTLRTRYRRSSFVLDWIALLMVVSMLLHLRGGLVLFMLIIGIVLPLLFSLGSDPRYITL